jgi:hypothetical protein
MLKKSYDKKEKGWEAFARPIGRGLFELTFKGPDILLMIVQDTPYASMMVEEISDLPAPWRPVGRGVILDEDPAKVKVTSDPYGLRQVSRRTFGNLMRISRMVSHGMPASEAHRLYNEKVARPHIREPVVTYGKITTPVISVGPLMRLQSPLYISEEQMKLRAELAADAIRYKTMKSHGYIH